MFAFGLCEVLLKCLLLTVCLDKSSLALRHRVRVKKGRERAVFHSYYSCIRTIKSHISALNGAQSTTDSFNVSNKTIILNTKIARQLYVCNSLGIEHGIYREINLCSCKMWVFKGIVHPKRKISVIIYSLLSGSKPVWISAVEHLRYIFEEHSEK